MTILITDPFHKDSISLLAKKNISFTSLSDITTTKHNKIAGALIRSKTIVNEDFLTQFPNLKFIASATSGLDHINHQICLQKNIEVFNPQKPNSMSAAEHTWALILGLNKSILKHNIQPEHRWRADLNRGQLLYNKTLGIVGLGKVGLKVAQVAQAFNMQVQAYDPFKNQEYFDQNSVKKVNQLNDIFLSSDIISLHTPLTDITKHFINKEQFNLLRKHAQLINTSRGQCIHEQDLIDAFKAGKIYKLGLDVFETEPIPQDHPLINHPRALLTPHVGAFTEEAFRMSSIQCVEWIVQQLTR